jgi:hypothetical protein
VSTSGGSAGSRLHARKEAGIVVDFVQKGATHSTVWSRFTHCSAPISTARVRVTPAPRRRVRARRSSSRRPGRPVTPDVNRRLAVIQREWQRRPRYLDEEEQRFWRASPAARPDDRVALFREAHRPGRSRAVLFTCAAENPNRRLRMMAPPTRSA